MEVLVNWEYIYIPVHLVVISFSRTVKLLVSGTARAVGEA